MLRRTPFARANGVTDLIEHWDQRKFRMATGTFGVGGIGLAALDYPLSGGLLCAFTGLFFYQGQKDLKQTKSTLLRNFPVLAHARYLLEAVRPEIRQYFIEGDNDANPFTRDQRSLVYARAKGDPDAMPFGTRKDVYGEQYAWAMHSMFPKPRLTLDEARVTIGEGSAAKPYRASILNISAMSYGALSHAAIKALNGGAKIGGFYHNTGEGGVSPFHLEPGGDLVWNIGTAYFSCRNDDGTFSLEKFKEVTSKNPQIKMIELKLSQGAKPGKGGLLKKEKVTPVIAATRGIKMGEDCMSPARHTAFHDPLSLLQFAAKLREESGLPIGVKMCVGDFVEVASLVRASMENKMYLDFITVDGSEGGTGAAPAEFSVSVGTPLHEGLYCVHSLLRGAGIRKHTKVIASGKVISGFSMFKAMHLGADLCNSARGFMFSLGCIQSLRCADNACPTGVATQDENRIAGLDVTDKRSRAANFQLKTVESCLDIIAASGFSDLSELRQRPVIMMRTSPTQAAFSSELFPKFVCGELTRIDKPKERLHASLQGMSHKDRVTRAWLISGDQALQPKIKLYMRFADTTTCAWAPSTPAAKPTKSAKSKAKAEADKK